MKIAPFKLERYFAKYEFNTPYLLSSSDCESLTARELLEFEPGALEGFQQLWLGYTESQGNPDLRQEISRLYKNIFSGEILVHSGAEEVIFNFMNAALKPGDHLIVQHPCYQSLFEVARSIGCEATLWEMAEDNGWKPDIDRLARSIRPNTRAIIINNPNNPTGYLMSLEMLEEIIGLARANSLLLLSDEVYRYLEYYEKDRLPAVCDLYEDGVSIGVMSKAFGLAGLRIGWSATRNTSIHSSMASFKDYTTICNSAPSEYLSVIALRNRDRILGRNLGIIKRNLTVLDAFFERYSHLFGWVRPRAGSIAFPHLKVKLDTDRFYSELLEKKGVMLLPGENYDYPGMYFRLGFGRRSLPESVARLEEYLRERFG